MKVNGNADLLGHINGRFEQLTDFPATPKVGTWAFINKSLWLCAEISESPFWIPITQERNTAVVEQPTPSTTWNVAHELSSESVLAQCFDVDGKTIFPSEIKPIDEDTLEITFPEAILGKTIVMYGYEEGANSVGEFKEGSGSALPVGMLADFPSRSAIAEGFLALDGQTITSEVYPELVKLLGGVDATEVTLPDVNGNKLFYRGGADDELFFGKIQQDAIRNFTGTFSNAHGNAGLNGDGVFKGEGSTSYRSSLDSKGAGHAKVKLDLASQVPVADENRPVNTSVVRCIKAFGVTEKPEGLDLNKIASDVNEIKQEKVCLFIGKTSVGGRQNLTTGQKLEVVADTLYGGMTLKSGGVCVPKDGLYKARLSVLVRPDQGAVVYIHPFEGARHFGYVRNEDSTGNEAPRDLITEDYIECKAGDILKPICSTVHGTSEFWSSTHASYTVEYVGQP